MHKVTCVMFKKDSTSQSRSVNDHLSLITSHNSSKRGLAKRYSALVSLTSTIWRSSPVGSRTSVLLIVPVEYVAPLRSSYRSGNVTVHASGAAARL